MTPEAAIHISTVPERRAMLLQTLRSLRGQSKHILVWCENQREYDPAIEALGAMQLYDGTRVGSIAKLRIAERAVTKYIFTCDDDVQYPPDYIAKMCAAVEQADSPVCVGARTYEGTKVQVTKPAAHIPTAAAHFGSWVNYPLTSSLAWKRGMFHMPPHFLFTCEDDAELAAHMQRTRTSLWCVERELDWLQPLPLTAGVSTLWDRARKDKFRDRQRVLGTVARWQLLRTGSGTGVA